ncbi:hypothetical protein [Ulvibacterium marinum]|uniref:Uncharacterized protein n=1 Tax=Ulvibacterium marinum TaxID=2419782 RepID=A0A3B0CBE5_9FLAO|nr:hypothetical protein [Ulvibacterium marinum]RKN83352.1 hypothetical protein D7Z94_05880 [Ulvibacterium marinum]
MEVINSFFSNIKDKLTNPFFGTLILVLLIQHWEFVYAIFNFDSDCTLDEKLVFLQNYISENITFETLFRDCAYALGYMTLGYLIIVGTRSLVLAIEFRLMPFLTGKIVSKKVVEKSLYDEVVKEREDYFDQYEEQRKNVRSFSKTIDAQNEQIKEKDKDLVKQSQNLSSIIKEKDNVTSKLSSSEKEKENLTSELKSSKNALDNLTKQHKILGLKLKMFESLYFASENEVYYTSKEDFPPEIRNKVRELKRDGMWEQFISVGLFFKKGGSLGGEVLSEMIKRNLAFDRDKQEDWTPYGRIIWKYKNLFDDENEIS